MNNKFTAKQIADWSAYEKVRAGGKYNMIAEMTAAIRACKMNAYEYMFVLNNYSELKQAADEVEEINLPVNKGGRPPVAEDQRRVHLSMRLPQWLLLRIDQEPGARSKVIEDALLAQFEPAMVVKAKCAGCGTTRNLHADFGSGGPWRCDSDDCIVY